MGYVAGWLRILRLRHVQIPNRPRVAPIPVVILELGNTPTRQFNVAESGIYRHSLSAAGAHERIAAISRAEPSRLLPPAHPRWSKVPWQEKSPAAGVSQTTQWAWVPQPGTRYSSVETLPSHRWRCTCPSRMDMPCQPCRLRAAAVSDRPSV